MSKVKGLFSKSLLNILESTQYEGTSVLSKPDRIHKIEVYESNENMQSFIKWFTQCITEENCVTKAELTKYNELKKAGELVPVQDLDSFIGAFCDPALLTTDMKYNIDAAKKELEAVESLENFLKENERKEKKKTSDEKNNRDLDDAISATLNDLNELNTEFNDTLQNLSTTWHELRSCYSQYTIGIQKTLESGHTSDVIAKMNKLKKKITENINYHLNNDFNEVLPTQGALDVTPEEYWLVFNRLQEVRNEIMMDVSKQEGILFYNDCLQYVENSVKDPNTSSFEEIRNQLNDFNYHSRIENSLKDILKNERDCLTSFKLEDAEKATSYLTDRLERLTKIEDILRMQKLYCHAFTLLMKRNALISDFQLKKLQESLDFIELYYKKFENRMNFMKNYKPSKEEIINHYHKKMMNDLDLKDMSLASLDAEISELHTKINAANESLFRELELFQSKVLNRLNCSKDKKAILFDGPTIEAFRHIFTDFIYVLEPKEKCLIKTIKNIDKIAKMFEEIAVNGQSQLKRECIWLKCINDPKFYVTVQEMKTKLELMKKF